MKNYAVIPLTVLALASLSVSVQSEEIIYEIQPKTGKRTQKYVVPDRRFTEELPMYREETTLSITIEPEEFCSVETGQCARLAEQSREMYQEQLRFGDRQAKRFFERYKKFHGVDLEKKYPNANIIHLPDHIE